MKLVLLPGMDGGGALSEGFRRALPVGWTSEVVEYPHDEALGYDELDRRVREQLPRQEPFIVVAESFSGPLGIRIAARPPASLVGLVLVATFATSPLPRGLRWLVGRHLFLAPPPAPLVRRFLVGPGSSDELVAAVRRATARVGSAVMAHRLREILAVDVRPELRRVRVPALSLRGLEDRLVRLDTTFRDVNPRMRCAAIEGPHLLLQARPTEAAAVVGDFTAEAMAAPPK